MTTQRLTASAQVTLDAAGGGTVELLVPYNQRWRIDRANVFTSSQAVPIPRFALYRNSAQPSNAISGTYTGSQDTAEFPGAELLEGGEKLIGVWTAGVVGSIGTLTISGLLELVT
jgi:hypothetical protein